MVMMDTTKLPSQISNAAGGMTVALLSIQEPTSPTLLKTVCDWTRAWSMLSCRWKHSVCEFSVMVRREQKQKRASNMDINLHHHQHHTGDRRANLET